MLKVNYGSNSSKNRFCAEISNNMILLSLTKENYKPKIMFISALSF